jgi:transcriptional regulator with XRE-family HTH domain
MRAVYDPVYIEFIARLRAARKASGYTQDELAGLLHKPQSYVSKVETSERRIDVIEAARWCAALGVMLEDVLPANLTVAGSSSTENRNSKTTR